MRADAAVADTHSDIELIREKRRVSQMEWHAVWQIDRRSRRRRHRTVWSS